jgi:hypothetical protein
LVGRPAPSNHHFFFTAIKTAHPVIPDAQATLSFWKNNSLCHSGKAIHSVILEESSGWMICLPAIPFQLLPDLPTQLYTTRNNKLYCHPEHRHPESTTHSVILEESSG